MKTKNLKKALQLIMLVFSLNAISQVIPNKDWVKIATGPTGLDVTGGAAAVDKVNGNVYMCGFVNTVSAGKDLFLIKYDSSGIKLWSVTYNFASFNDRANAVCIDGSGNVFVTGYSEQASGNADIVTIKYNSSGALQWSSRFNGSANSNDAGNSIGVDGSGNVWVCGFASITSKGKDYQILKYNSTGSLTASPKKSGTANVDDIAQKLVISGTNIYVTGSINNTTTNADVLTLCLNTTSVTQTWSTTANGSANGNDTGLDIKVDGSNVVLCGSVNNTTTGDDYYFARLSASTGTVSYSNTYDGGFNGSDIAASLVPDKLGNYAITGLVQNSPNYEYHTRVYNSSTALWTHKQPISGNFNTTYPHIATDTIAKHFYICGTYSNSATGNLDGMLYQLTPSGNQSWVQKHNGVNNGKDIHVDIVVDGTGRIYVSSNNETTTSAVYSINLIRYSQTPVYMPCNYSLAKDTFSMAHLFYRNTGQITNDAFASTPQVLFYTKYSSPIEFVLKDRVAFCETKQDTARVSPKDTISRVDMTFLGASENAEIFPLDFQTSAKLNYFLPSTGTDGITNVMGASHLMIPNIYPLIDLHYSSNMNGAKYYFVVKPGGNPSLINLQLTGAQSTTLTSNNLKITTKFSSFTFMKPYIYNVSVPSFTNLTVSTTSVTGTNGWVSMGGNTYSVNPGTYNTAWPLVIEFDKGRMAAVQNINNIKWSTYIGSGSGDRIQESKCDIDTNLFVTGETYANFFPASAGSYQSSSSGNSDGFVSKFNPKGILKWSSYIGSSGSDRLNGLDFNPSSRDIYCIGYSNKGDMILHNASGTAPTWTYSGTTGKMDGFIFDIDTSGTVAKWVTYFGGTSDDIFTACKFDPNANFFGVGYSKSTNFIVSRSNGTSYQYTVNNSSYFDGIIVRFDPNRQLTWSTGIGATTSTCGSTTSPNDYLFDCAISDAGTYDFYVVGSSAGCNYPNVSSGSSTNRAFTDGSDMVVSRFTNAGNIAYSSYFGGANSGAYSGFDEAYAVTISHSKCFVAGVVQSPSITPVNSGGYYYQGTASSPANGSFLVLDASDNLKHFSYFGGSGYNAITDILIDDINSIYVAGPVSSTNIPTTGSNPSGTYTQTYKGSWDNFICALQGYSGIVWSTFLGGTNQETSTVFYDRSVSICYDSGGNIYLTGLTQSDSTKQFPLDNGAGIPWFSKVLNGTQDATITKFDIVPLQMIGIKVNNSLFNSNTLVYPNPTDGQLNIVLNSEETKTFYRIFDCMGREVNSGKFQSKINTISVNDFSNGIYFLEVYNSSGKYSTKFVKQN